MWTQIWFCSSVSFVQTTSYRGNSSFQDLFIPLWEPSENHGEDIQVTVRLFGKTGFLPDVINQLKEQSRMAGSWFREEILSQCVHDTDGSRAAMSRAASQKTNSSSRKMLQHVRELLHSSLSCVHGVQIKVVRDGSVPSWMEKDVISIAERFQEKVCLPYIYVMWGCPYLSLETALLTHWNTYVYAAF